MIKNVQEFKAPTVQNIATLMASRMDEDRYGLENRVETALKKAGAAAVGAEPW